MFLSYSSFKNDIKLFEYEEYYKNDIVKISSSENNFLVNEVSSEFVNEQELTKSTISNFFDFIKYYKNIENEDFKKPIFSQTSKFKKTTCNYKNYKYIKINRDNDEVTKENKEHNKEHNKEFKKAWNIENFADENTKILITIKTFLNKISEETYKKISNDFINEILKIRNENLFEILCKEILSKCLYDNKYRNLYINLCFKVWSNKDIHYNLCKINNNDNLFYWDYKNNIYGPFNSEYEAKVNIYEKLNFKKYFLNYIQNLYNNQDLNLENLSEEDFFIKKKNILLLPELITIMYLEKHIRFDIINLLIIDLLHYNIREIEIEIIYNLIKLLKEQKSGKLHEYRVIFTEFINFINALMLKDLSTTEISNHENRFNISKRSNFFLTDIINMLELLCNNNGFKNNSDDGIMRSKVTYENINKFSEILKNNNVNELLDIYNKLDSKNNKKELIDKFINYFIDHKNNNLEMINFLLTIEKNDSELIYEILDNNINNIEDIMLDVPNADKKIIYIVEKLNTNEKENYLSILQNIVKDNDSE
jgi:hypothetical protein